MRQRGRSVQRSLRRSTEDFHMPLGLQSDGKPRQTLGALGPMSLMSRGSSMTPVHTRTHHTPCSCLHSPRDPPRAALITYFTVTVKHSLRSSWLESKLPSVLSLITCHWTSKLTPETNRVGGGGATSKCSAPAPPAAVFNISLTGRQAGLDAGSAGH